MNFYISDIHFGHSNVIRFDHRPFFDRDEMDRVLIHLWNERVEKDDNVYIVGDFCYRNEKQADWYLRQLKGKKYLIIGNHDGDTLKNERALGYFETIDKMMHVTDRDKQICLCHFPIAEWNGYHKGHWHVYGHIHGRMNETYEFMSKKERALNAAVCINNYTPANINELIRNNNYHRERFMNMHSNSIEDCSIERGGKYCYN